MLENDDATIRETNPVQLDEVDYRLLFESSPTPHLVVRADSPRYTIMAASDSYLLVTNKTRSALIGKGVFEAFPENPDDVSVSSTGMNDLRISFDRVLQTAKPDVLGFQRYDIPKVENSLTEFEVKYWSPIHIPILDRQGKVCFILQRVEDVTEYVLLKEKSYEASSLNQQKEAEILRITREVKLSNREIKQREQELAQLNERLKELDRIKTEFFSNVSHEFRTPLTLMLSPLEDLLNNPENSCKPQIDMVYRNAVRLLKLVNTLLNFSKIEAGGMQVTYSPCDLSKYTAELASHFDSVVEKSDITYVVDCPALPELVYVDPNLWDKIVLNLLSNSFKHTFEGKIEIKLRLENQTVVLIVQDTGTGIAANDIPFLFDRFYRVANAKSRTYEGSGIGLALVKEFVKIHHGTIQVESIQGQGTSFIVRIPAGCAHLPAHLIQNQPNLEFQTLALRTRDYLQEVHHWLPENEENVFLESATDKDIWQGIDPNQRRKALVLLVDDNRDMRSYIKRVLNPHCEVRTATDGLDALNKIHQYFPDLILSDVMMPNMSGFELLHAIRTDKALHLIPFILISARAGEEATVEGLDCGADDYLVKPFSVKELLARVKSNLDHHRIRSKINAELANISAYKSQFISNMSHELRTPLNAIIGYSEMILKGMVTSPEKQQEYLGNVALAGRHLLDLINDILDLSKIEAGKIELNFELIELKAFMAKIHSLLIDIAAKKDIQLNFSLGNIDRLKADPVRLTQILINLINNAIKFNRPGGSVNVCFVLEGQHILCHVQDTGIGICENKLSQLFTEFYQVRNNSHAQEGTGLGLALTKRIVELHGGTISVESQVDVGSTFTFSIPV